MNTFADRIKLRMEVLNLNQDELGRLAGLTQPAIHKLQSGKTLSTRRLFELAQALQCSPHWLRTGRGPMQDDLADIPIEIRQAISRLRRYSSNSEATGRVLQVAKAVNDLLSDLPVE